MADFFGVWGSITGTLALGFNVFQWWKKGRATLKLSATYMDSYDPVSKKRAPGYLGLKVVNRSEHEVKLTNMSFFRKSMPKEGVWVAKWVAANLPRDLKPHEATEIRIPYDEAEAAGTTKEPVKFHISISTDESFESGWLPPPRAT